MEGLLTPQSAAQVCPVNFLAGPVYSRKPGLVYDTRQFDTTKRDACDADGDMAHAL
jgi:hypothetical protein